MLLPVMYIDGKSVAAREILWGIEYASGNVFECADESDARIQAELLGATVKSCQVYTMDWEDA